MSNERAGHDDAERPRRIFSRRRTHMVEAIDGAAERIPADEAGSVEPSGDGEGEHD